MKKRSIIIYCAVMAWLPLIGSGNSLAADYIEPNLNEELFKLEKIPLQVDKMHQLSGYLVVLAKRPHNRQPAQQRATAQLIALAEALSPANPEVRNLNRALASKKAVELSTAEEISQTTKRLRSFKRWLSQPDAGEEANRLSHFLNDATKTLDPDTFNNKDLADWKSSIPSLRQYKSSSSDNIANNNNPDDGTGDDDGNSWDNPFAEAKKFSINELTIKAPFALQNSTKYEDPKTGDTKFHITRKHDISEITLSVRPTSDPENAYFRISTISRQFNKSDDPVYQGIRQTLFDLMQNRHREIAPHRITITISSGNYARSNQLALTAPVAMMLESSMTKQALRKDVLVCADIDVTGTFRTPANLWTSLNHLRSLTTGGRLIVPNEASSVIMQILALEKPDFFIRWEVYAVNNLDEAMLVAASKSNEKLSQAVMLYDSVQDLAQRSAVTTMTMNRAVRSRLSEVASLSPQHLSSRALLLYGSNQRPRRLNQKGEAHSIFEAVTHMRDSLTNLKNFERPRYDTMKRVHEKARALLDPLERVVERSDKSLHHEATELANDFRSLANLIRRGRGSEDWDDFMRFKVGPDYMKLRRKSHELYTKVRAEAGYPEAEAIKEEIKD